PGRLRRPHGRCDPPALPPLAAAPSPGPRRRIRLPGSLRPFAVLCGFLRGSDRLGGDRSRRVGCPRHGSRRCWHTCPRRVRRRILLSLAVLGLLVAGAGVAVYLKSREHPQGKLDTELKSVSVETVNTGPIKAPKHKGHHLVDDKRCWLNFGGNPQRTLARPSIDIGLPLRHFWVTGLGSYIEYPPSYCGGILYVNTFGGKTVALNSHNGHVIWQRHGGRKPSTPAIAGPRLIVSTYAGSIWCLRRSDGHKVCDHYIRRDVLRYESFYASVSTDGRRLFTISRSGGIYALSASNGRIVWHSSVNSWGYSTPAVARG